MDYGHSALGERLAADYVLGLMPRRARQRFERAMDRDATLAARVAAWGERLTPLDTPADDTAPPPRVWRAIEGRIARPGRGRPAPERVLRRWLGGFAAAAVAAAAVALCVAIEPAALRRDVLAFADKAGLSGWLDSATRATHDIGLSTLRLGVGERERPRWIRAALLVTDDALPLTAVPPRRSP